MSQRILSFLQKNSESFTLTPVLNKENTFQVTLQNNARFANSNLASALYQLINKYQGLSWCDISPIETLPSTLEITFNSLDPDKTPQERILHLIEKHEEYSQCISSQIVQKMRESENAFDLVPYRNNEEKQFIIQSREIPSGRIAEAITYHISNQSTTSVTSVPSFSKTKAGYRLTFAENHSPEQAKAAIESLLFPEAPDASSGQSSNQSASSRQTMATIEPFTSSGNPDASSSQSSSRKRKPATSSSASLFSSEPSLQPSLKKRKPSHHTDSDDKNTSAAHPTLATHTDSSPITDENNLTQADLYQLFGPFHNV